MTLVAPCSLVDTSGMEVNTPFRPNTRICSKIVAIHLLQIKQNINQSKSIQGSATSVKILILLVIPLDLRVQQISHPTLQDRGMFMEKSFPVTIHNCSADYLFLTVKISYSKFINIYPMLSNQNFKSVIEAAQEAHM